jgi:SSS family solute:Na+ symporter/sodium/proline symporter
LAGSVAIVFSTATTFLMVPSTNLARDVYQRFINPDVSEKRIVFFQRIAIVFLALVALLATTRFESILAMALYAYTMVGAAVTPALLAAFLWKRATPAGGVASVGLGMLATIVFGVLANSGVERLPLGFVDIPLDYDYIIYPAATLSILGLVFVSLATGPSPDDKWRPFVTN